MPYLSQELLRTAALEPAHWFLQVACNGWASWAVCVAQVVSATSTNQEANISNGTQGAMLKTAFQCWFCMLGQHKHMCCPRGRMRDNLNYAVDSSSYLEQPSFWQVRNPFNYYVIQTVVYMGRVSYVQKIEVVGPPSTGCMHACIYEVW